MRITKNKIRTAGYFTMRLRDCGFVVLKIFQEFSRTDARSWVVLVNPGEASVFITCYRNRENFDDIEFELSDGGVNIPRNFFIKTDSLEVIVAYLLEHKVSNNANWPLKQKFLRPRLSNLRGTPTRQPERPYQEEETSQGEESISNQEKEIAALTATC